MTALHLRFLEAAERWGGRPALVDAAGASVSYEALAHRALRLAAGLRERLGDEPRIVAVAAGNHAEHVVAMLGLFLSGHVWFPLNPRAASAFHARVLDRVRPALVLRDAACADCVDLAAARAAGAATAGFAAADPSGLEALSRPADGFRPAPDDPQAAMSVKLTGGTTGEPKAVIQTQAMIATAADDLATVFHIGAEDVNLAVAPLSHGAFHLLFPVLLAGGRHEIVDHARPGALLDLMAERGVSLAFMPPTLIVKLAADPGARPERFPRLRELIYSAAPMAPAQIARAQAAFGPRIAVMYGQVEAPVAIAAMDAATLSGLDKPTSVGRPCPSTEVRLSGTGEVLARGPLVARAYLTGEPFPLRDGWLATGDLGAFDADGFLHLKGRARELIISGGFNVYPAEVERALLALDGVAEACVFGVEDPYWGERVEAAVVTDPQARPGPDDETLTRAVREAIGAAAAPKAIHRLDALPRNPVGKVVRRQVREAVLTRTGG